MSRATAPSWAAAGSRKKGVNAFRCCAWLAIGLGMLGLISPVLHAQPVDGDESLLKAAFVFNFAKFSQWPASAEADARLNLCVAGDDATARALADLDGHTVQGRPLRVRYMQENGLHRDCHLLYVAASESASRQSDLIAASRGLPLLTIGDSPRFARQGGGIALTRQGKHLRFIVNLASLRAAGLEISPNLLRLGQVIHAD